MRLGLIARADNTGLGIQTYEFYKHMQPSKTMVVDISHLNGNKQYLDRYTDAMYVRGFPTPVDIDKFLQELDVVFVAESPYNYYLYERARELGVKTVVQYNYEFFDWFANPHYPMPDMLAAPSRWHFDEIDDFAKKHGIKHEYLHCPVNRKALPFKERDRAYTFLHIAGKPAAHDRNGTETVIAASRHVKNPNASIVIHFQGEQGLAHQATHSFDYYVDYLHAHGSDRNIMMAQLDYENYADLYKDADVLLLPRRYGGNCLPVNEALSCGMPVIMTDISPNNDLLPRHWLVPTFKIGEFTPRTTVDIYASNDVVLAQKIDEFANAAPWWVALQSNNANAIAEQISWDTMKPKYVQAFEELING